MRAARRPPGFRAAGPPCSGPTAEPRDGEDLCYLLGDWQILQRLDGHRWSLDDFVTAAVASQGPPPRWASDLGSGIGSVLLMLAWRFQNARLIGVEAQALSVDLCRRSIAHVGAGDRVEARHGDLRDPSMLPEGPIFDLVTGTPPYLPEGSGVASDKPQRGPCRFETRGGIEAYCAAAARLLVSPKDDRAGGRFVVCEDSRQIPRVEAAAKAAGLAVLRRVDVVPRAGKMPLFSVFSCGREPGGEPTSETLVVRDDAGRRTEAFRAMRAEMGLPH